MNWRFIFNTIIIVLILHFILSNIDLKITIGTPAASNLDAHASLKFLTGEPTLEGFDPRQDLLDYVNNKTNDVRGMNFYKTNYNTPKFDSNLMDVQSFYNINYDNNDCTKFGFDGINLQATKVATPIFEKFKNANTNANLSAPPQHTQNVPLPHQSEQWNYKNDLAMNGAPQGGVMGYSSLSDDYAPYQTGGPFTPSPNIATANAYQNCTGPTADLRYERQNYEP